MNGKTSTRGTKECSKYVFLLQPGAHRSFGEFAFNQSRLDQSKPTQALDSQTKSPTF
uniref:Uncharacterized protein n=1 Tax=Anguilla anguilla TaxID=7936 RepID=A0A0E9SBQ2_ANGAN